MLVAQAAYSVVVETVDVIVVVVLALAVAVSVIVDVEIAVLVVVVVVVGVLVKVTVEVLVAVAEDGVGAVMVDIMVTELVTQVGAITDVTQLTVATNEGRGRLGP